MCTQAGLPSLPCRWLANMGGPPAGEGGPWRGAWRASFRWSPSRRTARRWRRPHAASCARCPGRHGRSPRSRATDQRNFQRYSRGSDDNGRHNAGSKIGVVSTVPLWPVTRQSRVRAASKRPQHRKTIITDRVFGSESWQLSSFLACSGRRFCRYSARKEFALPLVTRRMLAIWCNTQKSPGVSTGEPSPKRLSICQAASVLVTPYL